MRKIVREIGIMNTMDMDFYSICPNGEPFLLYGENDFAKRTYKCLTEKGYCVKGYIDQKYSGYEEDQGIIRTDLKGVKKLQGGVCDHHLPSEWNVS